MRTHSWVAIFQFLVCIPLAVPAALAGNPAVSPSELPRNLWDGWMCYLGYNSVVVGEHPDNCWPDGPLYVTLYLVVNINYNILITLVRARQGDGRPDFVSLACLSRGVSAAGRTQHRGVSSGVVAVLLRRFHC